MSRVTLGTEEFTNEPQMLVDGIDVEIFVEFCFIWYASGQWVRIPTSLESHTPDHAGIATSETADGETLCEAYAHLYARDGEIEISA